MTIPFAIEDITSLMPMPVSSVRMAEMVADPASTVRQFARVIELDQALTANVLRWANSAASHPATKITTVRKAVIRLGAANVLKLTVGQHLLAAFGSGTPGRELTENELWRHGVAAAMCAEQLEAVARRRIPGMAFTAALMHDVGKLLLGRRVGYDALAELVASVQGARQVSALEAEREVLGTDHAEVGGAMARYWEFPEPLIAAIEQHHLRNENGDVLLDTVIVSDYIAKLIPGGNGAGEAVMTEDVQTAITRLGMQPGVIPTLQERITGEINRSESLWKVA
jgi:putative nucleotidyltransferase with HDIG domain